MSKILASYRRTPIISGRKTKTAYLDLFDNGISANVVMFVDRFKLQIPKWVMRDFLSLAAVVYPEAAINRRVYPERVEIKDAMLEQLAIAGFRYNPGQMRTYLPDAMTDPNSTLESVSGGDSAGIIPELTTKADIARAGKPSEMYQMIRSDIEQAEQEGAEIKTWAGIDKVVEHGWTRFEVYMSAAMMGKFTKLADV